MAVGGLRKAAMLLMSLDPATAAELLKGLNSDVVTNIAVELAYIDASGVKVQDHLQSVISEFCSSINTTSGFQIKNFVARMLESSVGLKKAQEIQSQISELLKKRDPFIAIRAADVDKLVSALQGEHPQAVALVLAELPSKKSSEVLGLLSEEVRFKTIKRLTHPENLGIDAKMRIAGLVLKRLENYGGSSSDGSTPQQSGQSLRKVATLVRSLSKELRDGLLASIKESDEQAAGMVTELMVLWEDIPVVLDRPLQESLRKVESQKLARALMQADEVVVTKIRSNMSERARTLLDEETALISTPKKEEIQGARDEIVAVLRDMNEKGELAFAE